MTLHMHRIHEFDYKSKDMKLNILKEHLATCSHAGNNNVLIAGYESCGCEIDALLIGGSGITAYLFMDWEGDISISDDDAWTADGYMIGDGGIGRNPKSSAMTARSTVAAGISRITGRQMEPYTRVCMVFDSGSRIADNLSDDTHKWLTVCPADGIADCMSCQSCAPDILTSAEIKAITRALGIGHVERTVTYVAEMQRSGIRQTSDSAVDMMSQLELIAGADTDARQKYGLLRNVFRRAIDQSVARLRINFSGTFAKLDFLIKENAIPPDIARQINDARKRLNEAYSTDESLLHDSLPYDIRAVALLITHLYKGMAIPPSLDAILPKGPLHKAWGHYSTNMLRCIVQSWDDNYITATSEQDATRLRVCYGQANTYLSRDGSGDWSYLRQILRRGAIINLVRLRFEDDVCMPELIVYEPDFLINITTIASCFETYAESPFVNLINKLKPQPNSIAIHLGGLSGQYLDDTIHQRDRSFAEGMMHFFKSNAIGLVSCEEMDDRRKVEQFYNDARQQKLNIEQAICHDLPQAIDSYDPKGVVLEPTFFSEVLGIQGRLDFLYEKDGDVTIIEQKSGKAAFVPFGAGCGSPDIPTPQEKHLVQLLLYRALFVYEFQKRSDALRHVMLLYSKFSKGLVAVAPSPRLLLRAMKMRNLLAWCEMLYATHGMRLLEKLTPASLNRKGISGRLWNDYIEPQLSSILTPIHEASALERAYFFRFMQFLEREQLLSKIGNKSKDDSGFAAKWLDTLQDKKASGNIYDDMCIRHIGTDGTSVSALTLGFAEEQHTDTSNFRKGDIVIFYPYKRGTVPNACAQMVNRATIHDITSTDITVVLRNQQTDKKVFDTPDDTAWAIEHDMFESSMSSLYHGMHCFLTANKERRDLILHQREPDVNCDVCPRGEYGSFNSLVTHAKQARDMFLIIGPPGTGKTSFGMLYQLQEELLEEGSSTLIMSYTNRAVDEICSKLKEPGTDIDFIRIGSETSCDECYHGNLLSTRVKACATAHDVRQLIEGTRVFCATTSSMNANMGLFGIKHFDLAIIDEASQILEPQLIGLLSARHGERDAIGRFVLIGDHKQLPAVVQQTEHESIVTDHELIDINLTDCRHSLFERMLSYFTTADGYDSRYVYMLTKQGRMHRDIAEFPNCAFYGNRLEVVPLSHQLTPCRDSGSHHGIVQLITSRRIAFVASERPSCPTSPKTNQAEADMIAATVVQIYRLTSGSFSACDTVGVIVPYRNQIATIRNAIDQYGISVLHDITIDTVERYQGSQRDYIIYGFTVQEPYQLNFLTDNVFEEDGHVIDRKLNVAMTRARLHLMLIGNPDILTENYTFYKLMEFVRSKDGYIHVPCADYCAGRFAIPTHRADSTVADGANDSQYGRAFDDAFSHEVESYISSNGYLHTDDSLKDIYMSVINYGRSDFSAPEKVYDRRQGHNVTLSAADQVRLYCHYFMRAYLAEACHSLSLIKDWLHAKALHAGGMMTMVDIGCGPATGGIALAMTSADAGYQTAYIGIDISLEMRKIGSDLLNKTTGGAVKARFASSLTDITVGGSYAWADEQGVVIFHIAHFFECINGSQAQEAAQHIKAIVANVPQGHAVLIIQQPHTVCRLRSYQDFMKCVSTRMTCHKHDVTDAYNTQPHADTSVGTAIEVYGLSL